MKYLAALALIFSLSLVAMAIPAGSGEKTEYGNKDIPQREEKLPLVSTQIPESSADNSENWEQSKEDSQSSLFLNKSDKNDLEPYPMALSDDAYDGQPIGAGEQISQHHAQNDRGKLEHLVMRSELYGEPPSMAREAVRRKRAGRFTLRSIPENPIQRINKMEARYSAINRAKRESNAIPSEDLLTLLSLWEEQQARNNDQYYIDDEDPTYNNRGYYDDDRNIEDTRWYNEPVIPSAQISRQNYPIKPIFGHRYNQQTLPETPYPYLQNLEALRRKRQWAGFGNRVSKRFMVAKKKRSEGSYPNLYFSYPENKLNPYEVLSKLNFDRFENNNQNYVDPVLLNVQRRKVL